MDRFLNRRLFLKLGGLSLALGVADTSLARRLADGRVHPGDLRRRPRANDQRATPLLVTVFLRGGADGLNLLPPTGSERSVYDSYRPGIGVPMGDIDGAGTRLIDGSAVDSGWALNPRMTALMPSWEEGALAILPDVHYDEGSRSHFDSQQFYENGTPWQKFTPSGWMNRHLQTTTGDPLLRAIAFDGITPFTMQGEYPTLTFAGLDGLSVSGNEGRNERFLQTQEQAYPTKLTGPEVYDPEVGQAGADLIAAVRAIGATDLPPTDPAAESIYALDGVGANNRHGYFSQRLRDLAQLVKSNAFQIEMAQVDLSGWDTHNLQLMATNNHPDLCEALARGLAGFRTDLGDFMENVVVVVMSEFGRTARENGSAGTDHGSATPMLVMGDPTKLLAGRRILHGPAGFAGLEPENLRQDRDLVHSTDYRSVLAEIVRQHMGNDDPSVFPDFEPTPVGLFG